MGILTELKDRWKSESPAIFVKLQNIAISVGGSAAAVWVANSSMSLNLSETILSVCKYTIAACAAMGLTSKITKKD